MLQIEHQVRAVVEREIEQSQREFFLREQLKAIQRSWARKIRPSGRSRAAREGSRPAPSAGARAARGREELRRLERHADRLARIHCDSHLPGLARGLAVDAADRAINPDLGRATRMLDAHHYGLDKSQGAHPRISGGAEAGRHTDRAPPILCFVGPPGVGKTSPGPLDRRRAGPALRHALAGRHPRRGRDSRPPPHLHRRAARAAIIEAMQRGRARSTRSLCSTRSTRSAPISAATRPRRCWRCSTPSRITPFATTTWMCRSISRTGHVHHHGQYARPDPGRRCVDRMEVIQLPGYTDDEKVGIARRFCVRAVAGARP